MKIDRLIGILSVLLKQDRVTAPELAEKFSIMYIPTLVLMENGTVVNKSTGFLQKEQILELLNTKN